MIAWAPIVTGAIDPRRGPLPLRGDEARRVDFNDDVVDSWLVRVAPNGTVTKVSYSVLTAGAPAGNAQCSNAFSTSQLPWPPSPTAVAPTVQCGTQRPGLNIAPAVAPDRIR